MNQHNCQQKQECQSVVRLPACDYDMAVEIVNACSAYVRAVLQYIPKNSFVFAMN